MGTEIHLYGAFDRFNYGDLLFPLICEAALSERIADARFHHYGLVASDLTAHGGVATRSLGDLCASMEAEPGHLVVVGGDVLRANYRGLLSYLPQYAGQVSGTRLQRLVQRLTKRPLVEDHLRQKISRAAPLIPFLPTHDELGARSIIYNGVSGALHDVYPETFVRGMRQAAYVSVRDGASRDAIERHTGTEAHLVPDSAALLARYFPLERALARASGEVTRLIERQTGYVTVQTNEKTFRDDPRAVLKMITELKQAVQLPIVLVPVGLALGHRDQVALAEIQRSLPECELVDVKTIYDIIAVIGHARLFTGTSLHGNITAMAYGLPHLGLGKGIAKLCAYLRSWDSACLGECVEIERVPAAAVELLRRDLRSRLVAQGEALARRSEANFDRIAETIVARS